MAKAKRAVEPMQEPVIAPAALAEAPEPLQVSGLDRKQGESDQAYAHRCSEEFVS